MYDIGGHFQYARSLVNMSPPDSYNWVILNPADGSVAKGRLLQMKIARRKGGGASESEAWAFRMYEAATAAP